MKEHSYPTCPKDCGFGKDLCQKECYHHKDKPEDYEIVKTDMVTGKDRVYRVIASNPMYLGGELYLDDGSVISQNNPHIKKSGTIFKK